jgi:hypothetical protein
MSDEEYEIEEQPEEGDDILDELSLGESSYNSDTDSQSNLDEEAEDEDEIKTVEDIEDPDKELEDSEEPEVSEFEIKESSEEAYKPYKKCIYVDNRITHDYLSSFEYAAVIGFLAETIARTGIINIDHKGESDTIKIAEMTFNERKTGLIIKRFIGTNKRGLSEYELWKVDEMKY